MKRLLCVLLIMLCVLSLGSCELLEKFVSFERLETDAPTDPAPTAPDANEPDDKEPGEDKTEATTNDKTETTPQDQTENTTNDVHEGTTPVPEEETTPSTPGGGDSQIPEGNGETITVEVKFQSGGVHGYQEKLTVVTPITFTHVLSLFAQMHEDISSYRLNFYLNGVLVDANDSTFLKDGDYIYLEESSDGSGDLSPCSHNWVDGSCMLCGMPCPHNEWDDNRQCLACGSSLGVDLLQIEFYMDGEYCSCTSTIESTVGEQLMYQFWRSWDDLTSTYDVYVGDILVTDESYMILESCNIYLVTRSHE